MIDWPNVCGRSIVLRYRSVSLFSIVLAFCVAAGCASNIYDRHHYPNLTPSSQYYRVKRGDTLYGIARKAGRDYRQIAAINNIRPPYSIIPGQTIALFGKKKDGVKRKLRAKKASKNPKKIATAKKNKNFSKKRLKIRWQWPIKGLIAKNFSQTGRKGLDIVGKLGHPVRAAAAGKIVYSGQGLIGYGNLVIVKHNEQYLSAYANNSRLLVREGDYVKTGQTIAEVGRIANKRPSLYFEIRKNGKPVNPTLYLPKP